jgi:S-adenosylmethionine:tRNA ribosyltransferase-isomerase
VLVSDFDYTLPEGLIAQEPPADRGASRLLVVERASGQFFDRSFAELPEYLRAGDVLAVNDSGVIRARLFGRRLGVKARPLSPRNPAAGSFLKGRVEALLTKQLDAATWEALVHPGRKIGVGERLLFGEGFEAEVIGRGTFGERTLRFRWTGDFFEHLERLGHVPLPPYIRRQDRAEDAARYQTVYARAAGSVAAPTAGLHFTAEMLDLLRRRGVEVAELTLHVGLGTFQPVRAAGVEEHRMHAERYQISPAAAAAVNRALEEGRRVVAVGTTAVRTLEHSAGATGRVQPEAGETALFIYPGFCFRVAGALLTNFHLPRSTLLMLVCAFAGRDLVLKAYAHAVEQRYRFYSYGDCMLVL